MKGFARRWLAAVGGSLLLATALAQDEAEPDLEFLEYLGAWEDSDEEWLAVSRWEDEPAEAHRPPAREGADRSGVATDEASDEVDDAH